MTRHLPLRKARVQEACLRFHLFVVAGTRPLLAASILEFLARHFKAAICTKSHTIASDVAYFKSCFAIFA